MFHRGFRFVPLMAAVLLMGGCAALKDTVKEPNVAVDAVKLRNVSLTGMQMDFVLGVDNPNPLGLNVQGLTYNLALDGKQMFDGKTEERVRVPANGNAKVTVPFSIDYKELLGGIEDLRNKKTVKYNLSGNVNLGLLTLPYTKRGEFTLPTLPDVEVSKVNVTGFGLNGVGLVLGLKVANDNNFPLKLSGLTGGIKMAGVPLVSGKSLGGMNIGAQQKGDVEFALNVGYSKLGDLLNKLRSAQSIPIAFDGAMTVPALGGERQVPLNWSGDVPVFR